ncbi:hypothetical protein ABZP36_016102 [Zizania latifolia]
MSVQRLKRDIARRRRSAPPGARGRIAWWRRGPRPPCASRGASAHRDSDRLWIDQKKETEKGIIHREIDGGGGGGGGSSPSRRHGAHRAEHTSSGDRIARARAHPAHLQVPLPQPLTLDPRKLLTARHSISRQVYLIQA